MGGAPTAKRGWNSLLFGKVFAENYMEVKEIGPRGIVNLYRSPWIDQHHSEMKSLLLQQWNLSLVLITVTFTVVPCEQALMLRIESQKVHLRGVVVKAERNEVILEELGLTTCTYLEI